MKRIERKNNRIDQLTDKDEITAGFLDTVADTLGLKKGKGGMKSAFRDLFKDILDNHYRTEQVSRDIRSDHSQKYKLKMIILDDNNDYPIVEFPAEVIIAPVTNEESGKIDKAHVDMHLFLPNPDDLSSLSEVKNGEFLNMNNSKTEVENQCWRAFRNMKYLDDANLAEKFLDKFGVNEDRFDLSESKGGKSKAADKSKDKQETKTSDTSETTDSTSSEQGLAVASTHLQSSRKRIYCAYPSKIQESRR